MTMMMCKLIILAKYYQQGGGGDDLSFQECCTLSFLSGYDC